MTRQLYTCILYIYPMQFLAAIATLNHLRDTGNADGSLDPALLSAIVWYNDNVIVWGARE